MSAETIQRGDRVITQSGHIGTVLEAPRGGLLTVRLSAHVSEQCAVQDVALVDFSTPVTRRVNHPDQLSLFAPSDLDNWH